MQRFVTRLYDQTNQKDSEKIYVAPQLLPKKFPASEKQFWPKSGLFFKYEYDFLHQVFIQRIVVRAGKLAIPKNVWQQGIWFFWSNTHAIVQAVENEDGPGGYIQLQVSGPKEEELLRRLQKEFEDIHPKGFLSKNFVSLDGQKWVNLEDIKQGKIERKNELDLGLYKVFLDKETDEFPKKEKEVFKEKGIKELEPTPLQPLNLKKIISWRNQLAQNNMLSVIEDMQLYDISRNQAIIHSARFYDLQSKEHRGSLSEPERQQLQNKLIEAVLYTIDLVEMEISNR